MAARLTPASIVPERLLRPLVHISMLTTAMVAGVAMAFLTQTLLARELGPAQYGLFASSLVTVTMLAPLAGFGLTQFRLKVYGVEGWAAHRWMQPSLRFTVFTTLLAIGLVVGWALVAAPANGTRFCLLVLTPVILSVLASDLVGNKLRLEDRYRYMALWQLMLPASRLAVAVALFWVPGLGYRFVAVAYAVVALLVTARAMPHLRALLRDEMDLKGHGRRDAAPVPAGPTPGVGEVWSQAWAYGLVALLFPVFFQISTVLLKYLDSDTQAGHYGIALSVMTAIYMIPVTIYQKFLLAKLHRWAAHDKPRFWQVYRQGNYGMFAFGLLIALALAVLAPWVVPLVFGRQYAPVVGILMVLAWCVPLRFLAVSAGSVLLTENHMRYRVYALAAAASTVVLLNLVLIPRFHALGAAWATVVGEAMLLLATVFSVRRFVLPQRHAVAEVTPC